MSGQERPAGPFLGEHRNLTLSGQYRPGWHPDDSANYSASSALLPIRVVDNEWDYHTGSVFIAGGDYLLDHELSARAP